MTEYTTFAKTLSEELVIDRPVDVVYGALHKLADWPKHLPHVPAVDILYDDGTYQEFRMEVISEGGKRIRVRSIRKCNGGDRIEFFQPQPPVFLRHHAGFWTFKDQGQRTLVGTKHYWTVEETAASEQFPTNTGEHVKGLLAEHARFALSTWKKVLEA
jgi:aromatase